LYILLKTMSLIVGLLKSIPELNAEEKWVRKKGSFLAIVGGIVY
jgi:hypothetical protein